MSVTHPRWHYKNSLKYNKILDLEDVITFHYTFVKPSERIRARWEIDIEKGYTRNKYRYERFMEIKWKDDNDILNYKDDIEKIINRLKGFNVYYGKHPKILDTHPWKHLDDCILIT